MAYPLSEAEQDRAWNSPETLRLRALDAQKLELDQRMRALDQLEADAKATRVREKLLNAPATAAEAAILESARIVAHVNKIIGTDGIDLSEVNEADFNRALRTAHVGFVDGRTAGEHLRDLRLGLNQPAPIVEDEVVDNTGLHEILRRGARK